VKRFGKYGRFLLVIITLKETSSYLLLFLAPKTTAQFGVGGRLWRYIIYLKCTLNMSFVGHL
jgi:hypothetical protein